MWLITKSVPLWALIKFLRALRFLKSKNTSGSSIISKSGLVNIDFITWISLNSPPLSWDMLKFLYLINSIRFNFLSMIFSKSSPLIDSSKASWYFSSKVSISEDVSISVHMAVISFWSLMKFSAKYSKTVISCVLSISWNWHTYPILQLGSISNEPSNKYFSGSINISIRVLFPLPFVPIKAQCWPSSKVKEISLYKFFWGNE